MNKKRKRKLKRRQKKLKNRRGRKSKRKNKRRVRKKLRRKKKVKKFKRRKRLNKRKKINQRKKKSKNQRPKRKKIKRGIKSKWNKKVRRKRGHKNKNKRKRKRNKKKINRRKRQSKKKQKKNSTAITTTTTTTATTSPGGFWKRSWHSPVAERMAENKMANVDVKVTLLCGGTLISSKHVLTAAQCVYPTVMARSHWKPSSSKLKPEELRATLGASQLFDKKDTTVVEISKITVHPNFNAWTYEYDFAILTLSNLVTFSYKIQTICLPPTPMIHKGENAIVTGWGINKLDERYSSPSLMKTNVTILDDYDCRLVYGQNVGFLLPTSYMEEGIGKSKMCAWDKDKSWDTCRGDLGGPLAITENRRYNKNLYSQYS